MERQRRCESFLFSDRSIFSLVPSFSLLQHKDFTCRSGVSLNPCVSATNEDFEKENHAFSLWSQECTTNISTICHEQKVQKWPARQLVLLIPKDFTYRSGVTLNPSTSATNENKRNAFNLGSQGCTTKISTICHEQKVQKWPARAIGTFDFTCRSGVNLNPCISAMYHHFEN